MAALASAFTLFLVSACSNPDAVRPEPTAGARALAADSIQCVYSSEYWKDHPGVWPSMANVVFGTNGENKYGDAKLKGLIATSPSNASMVLVDELIAAKLNYIAVKTVPGSMTTLINAADTWIGGRSLDGLPFALTADETNAATALAEKLAALNTGGGGVPKCSSCVHSVAFWTSHPDAWPVTALKLGTIDYSNSGNPSLTTLMTMTPVQTDSATDGVALARELIAAKLNVANAVVASSIPGSATALIAEADTWIGNLVFPWNNLGGGNPAGVLDRASHLAAFNTGSGGLARCSSLDDGGAGGGTPPDPADPTKCAQIGPAAGLNVFVSGTFTGTGSDVEGALAAGGEVTISGYSIGDKLEHEDGVSALIANTDLTFWNGQVNGDVWVGTGNGHKVVNNVVQGVTEPLTRATLAKNGATVTGALHKGTAAGDVPFPFSDADAQLKALSQSLATVAANTGTAEPDPGNTLVLSGGSVFTITTTDLASSAGVKIAAPKSATVVINVKCVSGTVCNASFPNAGIDTGGIPESRVLWNFLVDGNLEIKAVGVPGTVLAPGAAVTSSNGVVRGSLFAKSFTGSGQLNLFPFDGCLPK